MNEAPPAPDIRRVLVALDTGEGGAAALESAARLAAGLRAELVGLLIEDAEMLQAAALPTTRMVPYQARALADIDPASLQRVYRIWSAAMRRNLETVASQWRIKWSFQVARGFYAEQLTAAIRAGDLLALASSRYQRRSRTGIAAFAAATQASCSLFLMRHRWESWKPVTVVYQGAGDTLAMGRLLATAYGLPLVVLVLAPPEETAARTAEATLRSLAAAEIPADSVQIIPATAEGLGEALKKLAPGIVIFDRRGEQVPAIEAALEAADSSVLSLG